jgi:multiple sugar transport system substrate-binding protein
MSDSARMTSERRRPAPIGRRTFVTTAGAAAVIGGGLAGVIAAGRAPAFAQGTKLHMVRWVDFIPTGSTSR